MMRTLGVLVGMSCLLFADDEVNRKPQVTHTERVEFPAGGVLRVTDPLGELIIEGWDRPEVEIATTKSRASYAPRDREKAARELDLVRVSAERQGADIVVTTVYPHHRLRPRCLGPAGDVEVDYRIKAPRNAKLVVDGATGEVHVYNMTADISATVRDGTITLDLPAEGVYDIDAKSRMGEVLSDFPGQRKRTRSLVGHQFTQAASAPHKLYLRAGFGDIMVFKERKPQSVWTSAP